MAAIRVGLPTMFITRVRLEAGLISTRTKAALAAAKARNKKVGGDRGVVPTDETRARAAAALRERVSKEASDLEPEIRKLQQAGATSLRDIAAGLNAAGIPTPRGGRWQAVQVSRVLSRLAWRRSGTDHCC